MSHIDVAMKRMPQLTTPDWIKYITMHEPDESVEHYETVSEIAAAQFSRLDSVIICIDNKG